MKIGLGLYRHMFTRDYYDTISLGKLAASVGLGGNSELVSVDACRVPANIE